jgi:PAS domain S-box-containing protein
VNDTALDSDVSENRTRKESLLDSEQSFRLLVESVQDYGIFMLDPGGRIVTWNRGAERIKGYAAEQVVGKHFSVFYTPEDVERHHPDHELEVAVAEGRFEEEGWRVRADGSRFWANVVITALHDGSRGLVGFAKVTRDLTERKRAEEQREMLLVREHDARVEAEAANRAKSEFLTTMSHELRTPINAITGYTELLDMGLAGDLTEKQRAQLERIHASSRHLLALVEDILDLAKIEAGRIEVAREAGRLRESVDAALSLIGPQAAAGGIDLIDAMHAQDQLFVGDEGRLRQILVNLLSNAVKFTEPGGKVVVSCGPCASDGSELPGSDDGSWVCLRIEDTGVGIPREQVETVFEPFVQGDTELTRTKGGTGLGLTISRELARLMGGGLAVQSEPGKGSIFTLWLPTCAAPEGQPQDAAKEAATPTSEASAGLSEVGQTLLGRVDAVVKEVARRLRSDPRIPAAARMSDPELEDHQPVFLANIAQSLVILGQTGGEPELLRDGSEIQRLIAERHGRQRARFGWTEEALRHEFQIVAEEMEAAMGAAAPAATEHEAARQVLRRLLKKAERASIHGLGIGAG